MELREFAKQILFATTLEQKLRAPGEITDERPGSALVTPDAPGRPANLIFKAHAAGKSEFPGLHQLEKKSERGKLLHFFANHELLATELMALVLLKFPDAPAAFRKGVFQTLKDEQEHTRLYMERMKSCGVALGDLPVSGYFWRCIAPMENPIDYVAGLSLTFEQANLDFARHFAKSFVTIGDNDTGNLLKKIYRDEIGHVAYGLKWFRRWKNPAESDWDAFCRTLKFPLSPQRAKGLTLNVAGRKAAGLDEHFIAELNVYSQSRGRTPSVFVFNAFAEGFIAEGKKFNPTKHQAQLVRDLENLPQFLCRQDDILLVHQKPSVEFLSGIKQAGFPLPEFMELPERGSASRSKEATREVGIYFDASKSNEVAAGRRPALRADGISSLTQRKLGSLRPWAWGPDSFELLKPVFASVTGENRADENRFNDGLKKLYSKSWSADFLRKIISCGSRRKAAQTKNDLSQSLLTSAATDNWLCTENEIGVAVNSLEETLAAISKIRERGHHKIVIKESFGVAGSNAIRLFEPELLEAQKRWLKNAFAHKRELVIEPWLQREMDFSVQLEMRADGLKLCGFTGLINDARGQFVANFAEPHHHKKIPAKIISLFNATADRSGSLSPSDGERVGERGFDLAHRAPPLPGPLLHPMEEREKTGNVRGCTSGWLLEFYQTVFEKLEAELRAVDFSGPIGIDAFVYRDAAGAVKLKPIVEINPRYTMGRVLVELMRQSCQNCFGSFRLVNPAQLRADGFENFPDYAKSLAEKFPLQIEGETLPRIRSGALCLNDPATAKVCLAIFCVGKNLESLPGCTR